MSILGPTGSGPTNVNVHPSQLETITCDSCGNGTFEEVVIVKKVPAVLSPKGRDGIAPIPVFACASCGHVNVGFLVGVGLAPVPAEVEKPSSLILGK